MQENGRQRAAKIDRSYHAAFDPFVYRKRWMSVLGLVVALAYSAWMFSETGALHVTTGDLSQPHYAWNQTGCEQCHVPNVPIRKDAWRGDDAKNIAINNQKCNGQCHAVTGHFEHLTRPEILSTQSCSTCHREHLGFNRSLVDVADSECARCHANLAEAALHPKGQKPVSNFSKQGDGHPEFASLKSDPGTIRFSHVQHMRPGQPKSLDGADAKQPEMIPAKFRDRYRRVSADNLIQLSCSDCHARDVPLQGYDGLERPQGDANNASALAVQSTAHKLYLPIEFEKHCAACHDLDGIPHGLNRDQTNRSIQSLIPVKLLEYLKDRNPKLAPNSLAQNAMTKEYQEEIEGHELRLKAVLSDDSACLKCHQTGDNPASIVAPSNLKKKWFQDASFTHGSHLMVGCRECHATPYAETGDVFDVSLPGNQKSSDEASHVMIPGIEKCRECHIQSPKERSQLFSKEKPVASADCVDCHRYHSDAPRQAPSKRLSETTLSETKWLPFFARERLP